MVARGAIKHLGIKRSRDKDAGLPIVGTEAARVLTPERARRAGSAAVESGQARTKAHADRKSGTDRKADADRKPTPPGRTPELKRQDVASTDTQRAGARSKSGAGDQDSDPSGNSDA